MKLFAPVTHTQFDPLRRIAERSGRVIWTFGVGAVCIHASTVGGIYLGTWLPRPGELDVWTRDDIMTFVDWLNQREGLQ